MGSMHDSSHSHEMGDFKKIVLHEVLVHLPYAIFSVAFGMIVLSFVQYFTTGSGFVASPEYCNSSSMLFHSFHFLHIIFAATGVMITYLRYSQRLLRGIIIGLLSSSFFCVLSDVILPYIGSRALGADLHLHFCVIYEYHNVLPFLFVGIANGILLSRHHSRMLNMYGVGSHFVHILISSFASLFYLFSQGFTSWEEKIGPLFLFLIFAVVFPCTMSDVVVPLYFARVEK